MVSTKYRSAVISGKSLTAADPQAKPDIATAHAQSKRGDVSHAWALPPALTTHCEPHTAISYLSARQPSGPKGWL